MAIDIYHLAYILHVLRGCQRDAVICHRAHAFYGMLFVYNIWICTMLYNFFCAVHCILSPIYFTQLHDTSCRQLCLVSFWCILQSFNFEAIVFSHSGAPLSSFSGPHKCNFVTYVFWKYIHWKNVEHAFIHCGLHKLCGHSTLMKCRT